jgi:hypothetical protein
LNLILFYLIEAIVSIVGVAIAGIIAILLFNFTSIGIGYSFLIGMIVVLICLIPIFKRIGKYFDEKPNQK